MTMKLIEGVVERPYHLNPEWLRARGASAVPVESAYHFDGADAAQLASAFRGQGHLECFAVATEELAAEPPCYVVPTTREGLLSFSRKCGQFNYALVTKTRDAAVLCTSEEYFVVAGPERFVAEAVGASVAEARGKFMDFAGQKDWPPRLREFLLGVHHRYAEFGGQ
ncbi:MAG: hypothetical protein LC795_09800 [Acidobacteria bacterium]|nr:hypothetical protein [Acidobacteriota bacterium]